MKTSKIFSKIISNNANPLPELLENRILAKDVAYFDFTASGLAYRAIEERIASILPYYANTHSEVTNHALFMTELYEKARENLKQAFALSDEFVIFPCGNGATGAIKRFQELMGIYLPPRTKKRLGIDTKSSNFPVVIVGPYEHHSNEISYRESQCEVVRLPMNGNGLVDLDALKNVLARYKGREIIASFALASNVTGIVIPYNEISHLVREANGIFTLDMATTSPYMNIPCECYDAAFLSPHKLLGGAGSCGILIMRKSLIDATIPPSFSGGGTVTYVSRIDQYYREDLEKREEAGTPGIIQFLRASLAYGLRNELGLKWIENRKCELSKPLLAGLRSMERIAIYGDVSACERLGIFAINIEGISPYEVCQRLSREYLIETRAGCSCAGPYGHDLLNLKDDGLFPTRPGWVRISLHFSHTLEDIKRLLDALSEIARD